MIEPFKLVEQQYLEMGLWKDYDSRLVVGFTTKNGGTSQTDFTSLNIGFHVQDSLADVIENRTILSKKLNFPLNCWVGAEQTHETNITKVTHTDAGKGAIDYQSSIKATDGIYTSENNLLLTLCYADCVPIYFYAPKHKVIGMAHAGWKGTVHEIASKMIGVWREEGVPSTDIHVVIGPAICEKCYIVDDKVITYVENILEEYDEKPYNLINEGQYQLDLKALNSLLLHKAGVPKEQIHVSTWCTSCHSHLFYSHRRDKGKTGRLMSYIGWKEDSFHCESSR